MHSNHSLQTKVLWLASIVLIVFLGLTGFILTKSFRYNAELAAQERLLIHIYALLAAADSVGETLFLPERLPEERFNQLSSGLYGVITGKIGEPVWRSNSAAGLKLPVPNALHQGQIHFSRMEDENGQPLFLLGYGVTWEGSERQEEKQYTFWVFESQQAFIKQMRSFKSTLFGWLGGIGVVFWGLQIAILRWSLRPLKNLEQNIQAIEKGQSKTLEGRYPKELQGVVNNINLLVETEERQREKYKNTLADLAHSIKTPLAVLNNGLPYEKDNILSQQIQRINEIVSYQLHKAQQAAPGSIVSGIVINTVACKILEALNKVYQDKQLKIERKLDPDSLFYGDRDDLYELLGNLLDNACKYARRQVACTVRGGHARLTKPALEIIIEDDGVGIPEHKRADVLQRGYRVDTVAAGQGIGLSVVMELCRSYQAEMKISESRLGGAKVRLIFYG